MGSPVVIKSSQTLPVGVAGFQDYSNDPGAVAAIINSEMVKKSFPATLSYLLPKGDCMLFALTSKMKAETALQIEVGFNAKVMVFPQFTLSAAALIGDTTFAVHDASQVIPNGLYKRVGVTTDGTGPLVPQTTYASEIVHVTSVASNTSIVVARGKGAAATAHVDDSTFIHIGNAFADASVRPQSFSTKAVRVINYTQTFRNAWAISGTVAAIQMAIGGTTMHESKKECMQYHAMDMEKNLLFGGRSIVMGVQGTSNSLRTMGGIIYQIEDAQSNALFLGTNTGANNIITANSLVNGSAVAGALSLTDFENAVDRTLNMSYSPESGLERLLVVGAGAHKVLNRLFRYHTSYQVVNGTEWFGLRFMNVQLTRGTVTIVEHPFMNTNEFLSRMAIILDVPSLQLAYMTGRNTRYEEYNVGGNLMVDSGIDAQGGSLLSELTLLCKNPSGCGVITNIRTSVKADGLTAE